MKIRFKIDRVDLFRRGIDAPSPTASLDVNPSVLPENQRQLLARHLLTTDDDCDVVYDPERAKQLVETVPVGGHPGADLIEAKEPTLESLLEALTELESQTNLFVRTRVFCP
jgi:hypothetical protein